MPDRELRALERRYKADGVRVPRRVREKMNRGLCRRCKHPVGIWDTLCTHCKIDIERNTDTRDDREHICLCWGSGDLPL